MTAETHPSESVSWEAMLTEVSLSSYHGPKPTEPFWFGDSLRLCSDLNALVVAGKKTATASLLWEWEFDGEALPPIGQCDVLLSWSNVFIGIISTTSIDVVPFCDVSEEFAAREGEGDLSLEFWRKVHWSFFGRVCNRIDKAASKDMPVVCQEFKLEYLHHAA